jgi:hypothetical protein
MGSVDGAIVNGQSTSATLVQARAYVAGQTGRVLTSGAIDEVVAACWEFGAKLGIDSAIAFAQMCHETDIWRFTGDVEPEQHNPAGIGTTGGGVPGLTFPDWHTGIKAYFIHLLAWCDRLDLAIAHLAPDPTALDPRVPLVVSVRATKGKADTWRSLGGRWAVRREPPPWHEQANMPGNYGEGVERHLRRIQEQEDSGMSTPTIIDIRNQLPTRPNQGSMRKFAAKLGQVLHYSAVNYSQTRPIMDILISEANYHIRTTSTDGTTPLKEAGLAYHFTVDPQTGDIYQCRDEDDVLWHCGFWGTPGNENGLAIHVPGGDNLVMTDKAVQALLWLFKRNEAKYGFKRAALKGHLEVSATACPGPLMDSIVRPYRAGTLNFNGPVNPVIQDPVTGHTVHADLVDSYDMPRHGRPLQPAVLYSDGAIRQLFERAVLAAGRNGQTDTIETLGHAFLFVAGDRYPEWPGVTPLI